jgi:hypothetical protein
LFFGSTQVATLENKPANFSVQSNITLVWDRKVDILQSRQALSSSIFEPIEVESEPLSADQYQILKIILPIACTEA